MSGCCQPAHLCLNLQVPVDDSLGWPPVMPPACWPSRPSTGQGSRVVACAPFRLQSLSIVLMKALYARLSEGETGFGPFFIRASVWVYSF